MKFYINEIRLWLKDGSVRKLSFLPNKVNVITGNSETGKSSIIKIIDYCFLASSNSISRKFIGENVDWYGINFFINDKHFTIVRGSTLSPETKKLYYFSDNGFIPDDPGKEDKINESELRKIIETEFSIDSETIFAGGSDNIRQGSKISFRYFLWLFSIQTQNVLPSAIYLYDKQNEKRYRDALEILKVLDWAIGADSPKNILAKKKLNEFRKRLTRLEKIQSLGFNQQISFKEILGTLYKEAKELKLININIYDDEKIVQEFEKLIYSEVELESSTVHSEYNELNFRKMELQLKLKNLHEYKKAHSEYVSLLKTDADSLQPIESIKQNFDNILIGKSTGVLIDYLSKELLKIKTEIRQKDKAPFLANISDQLKRIQTEISDIQEKLDEYPDKETIKSEKDKYIFLGYVKSKLESFKGQTNDEGEKRKIEWLQGEIEDLETQVEEFPEKKLAIITALNESIDKNLEVLHIENYSTYKALYNDSEKRLDLRDPIDSQVYPMIEISSASSSMYLHLAFFLGLHELLLTQGSKYVPPFLILDQVSTPYYDNTKKEKLIENIDDISILDFKESDRDKLNRALNALDKFITKVNNEPTKDFQIILIEHIPESLWIEENFENFHLVDKEFRGGHKLINA